MSFGAPELLIILLIGWIPLVCGIATAVSASKYPESAFEAVGTSKTLWIVLPIVGIFACGLVTIVAAILWYSSYKPKVARAAAKAA